MYVEDSDLGRYTDNDGKPLHVYIERVLKGSTSPISAWMDPIILPDSSDQIELNNSNSEIETGPSLLPEQTNINSKPEHRLLLLLQQSQRQFYAFCINQTACKKRSHFTLNITNL